MTKNTAKFAQASCLKSVLQNTDKLVQTDWFLLINCKTKGINEPRWCFKSILFAKYPASNMISLLTSHYVPQKKYNRSVWPPPFDARRFLQMMEAKNVQYSNFWPFQFMYVYLQFNIPAWTTNSYFISDIWLLMITLLQAICFVREVCLVIRAGCWCLTHLWCTGVKRPRDLNQMFSKWRPNDRAWKKSYLIHFGWYS